MARFRLLERSALSTRPSPRESVLGVGCALVSTALWLVALVSAVATAPHAARAEDPAAVSQVDQRFELGQVTFHQRVLENGLVALAARDAADSGDETVSIFLAVDAGRRYETPETSGLAHLTEHALYTGTARTGADQHDARIHELGGESNATTRDDYILVYDHRLPVDALDEVLGMEADRLRSLTFDRAAVLHERNRLRDEEVRTYTRAMARQERLEYVAFPDHAYGVGVLESRRAEGATEDGLHTRGPELSVEAVRAFYDAHYHPNRLAVVVAGAVDPGGALDAVERAFGGLPRGPSAPRLAHQAPPSTRAESAAAETVLPSSLPTDRLERLWIGPALGDPDRPALQVLARWLGRQTLTDGAPVDAAMGGRLDADLFRLASTGPRAAEELADLLERVRDRPLRRDELAEPKTLLRDDVESLALRGRPYFSLASEVAIHALHGRLDVLREHARAIDAVTPERVLAAARRWLAPEEGRSVRFEGTGEERPVLPEDAGELRQLAMDASESGRLDLAVQAYSRLLELGPNRMNTVIYLASRGQLRVEQKDFSGAIRDYEDALAVVDYPAVRDLLDEARRLQSGGLRAPASDVPSPEPPSASASSPDSKQPDSKQPDSTKTAEPVGLEAQVEDLQRQIEDWRGLKFLEPVKLEVLSPEAVAGEHGADSDLAGWYEPETERLVVVDQKSPTFRRGTLLHELYHALQDQHYDLERQRAEAGDTVDAQEALTALIEGEAMLAVTEILSYDFEAHSELPKEGEIEEERYQKIFQYRDGLRFVRWRRDAYGWSAVDALWQAPPRSTREILHPEMYPREATDLQTAEMPFPEPPSGQEATGRLLREGRQGENQVRWLLMKPEETRAAAARIAFQVLRDRHRLFEGVYRNVEVWDLELHDPKTASRFARFATAGAEDEGWTVEPNDRFVRFWRTIDKSEP